MLGLSAIILGAAIAAAQSSGSVADIFAPDARNARVMQVEAAIATAQAEYGIIPASAAEEITRTASTDYAPLEEVEAEYEIVRHRMVALLNVWRRSLSEDAANALHLGITTVDIYDTVMILQLLDASDLLLDDMLALEQDLVCLAAAYRDTPMIGRTLGQHALPITFGKKVAVWAGANRRNIDRMIEVRARLRSSGILKGAVGTHLGLGDRGVEVERRVSALLGLAPPEPADWRAARDVFAEYAFTLALASKSSAGIGQEVFMLQMTDIAEVEERRSGTAVGSSTMPHKQNPNLSEALIYYGRTIPAMADILLEDVVNVFERDNTSRPNETLGLITIEAADMMRDTRRLIGRLVVDPARMRSNLDTSGGLIMSQRILLFLASSMDREDAEARIRAAALASVSVGPDFRSLLLADPVIGPRLVSDIDRLLDPTSELGLAAQQVDLTATWIDERRRLQGQPPLSACPPR